MHLFFSVYTIYLLLYIWDLNSAERELHGDTRVLYILY